MGLVRILLVSNHTLFAEALGALLEATPLERGARVVGCAASGDTVLRSLSELAPDLLLIDSLSPERGGMCLVDGAKLAKLLCPDLKVAILHGFGAEPSAGLPRDADAYLSNMSSASELLLSIDDIMANENPSSGNPNNAGSDVDDSPLEVAEAAQLRGETIPQGAARNSPIESLYERSTNLSTRELLILGYIIRGHKNREIATMLARSIRTVENQRFALLHKLGNPSPSQLINIAVRLKLLD